jgi:hypothetical protein
MPTLFEIMNNSGEEKTAAAQPQETQQAVLSDADEMKKVASELGIYNEMFPEDANIGETKTAEEIKVAAYQEALGARAYDYFAMRLDQRLEKIAGEIMSSSDMNAAQSIMQPTERPPQAVSTNQDPAGDKAPRNPVKETPYSIQGGAEHGAEGQVGKEEQQKMAMALAVRKHFMKSMV